MENELNGKKYFLKDNNSENLLIVLNTHNQKNRYFGFKTLVSGIDDIDILFITDPNNKYYLDSNRGESYRNLLSEVICKYKVENVSIFGTSMAGFAALYFGLYFNINIISVNPQIDLKASTDLAWPDLKKSLMNLESEVDIYNYFRKNYREQSIYIVFGRHRLDERAKSDFLKIANEFEVNYVINFVDSIEHKFFISDLLYLRDIHFLNKKNRSIRKILY